jgi:hypothetical protein
MKRSFVGIGVLIAGSLAYLTLHDKDSEDVSIVEPAVDQAQRAIPDSVAKSQTTSRDIKAGETPQSLKQTAPTQPLKVEQPEEAKPDLVKEYPNHFVGDLAAFATDQRYLEAVADLENMLFNLPNGWSDDSAQKVEQMFKSSGRKFVNSDTKCNARLCVTTGEVYDEEDFWKIYESLPESTGMAKWGMSYSLTKNDLGNTVFAMYKYRNEEDYAKRNN